MINFINSWIKGIIIAVIISTIIEMILPEGNIKKYVRTVIGIFIVFSIISPIVTKITGKEFKLKTYELPNTKNYQITAIDTNAYIENTYKEKLKQDMKKNIENLGYKVYQISLEVSKSEDNYGYIKTVKMSITKEQKQLSKIEQVEIYIGNEIEKKVEDIDETEKTVIKNYLSNNYGISMDQIYINS